MKKLGEALSGVVGINRNILECKSDHSEKWGQCPVMY